MGVRDRRRGGVGGGGHRTHHSLFLNEVLWVGEHHRTSLSHKNPTEKRSSCPVPSVSAVRALSPLPSLSLSPSLSPLFM